MLTHLQEFQVNNMVVNSSDRYGTDGAISTFPRISQNLFFKVFTCNTRKQCHDKIRFIPVCKYYNESERYCSPFCFLISDMHLGIGLFNSVIVPFSRVTPQFVSIRHKLYVLAAHGLFLMVLTSSELVMLTTIFDILLQTSEYDKTIKQRQVLYKSFNFLHSQCYFLCLHLSFINNINTNIKCHISCQFPHRTQYINNIFTVLTS